MPVPQYEIAFNSLNVDEKMLWFYLTYIFAIITGLICDITGICCKYRCIYSC